MQKYRALSSHLAQLAIYITVLAVIIVLAVYKEKADLEKSRALQRQQTVKQAEKTSADLSAAVTAKLLVARGMTGAVSLRPDIDQEQFSRLSAVIMRQDTSVVNIASIRNMAVTHVHPYRENAKVLGRSLRDVPEQLAAAEQARDSGQTVLQGPVGLMQGYPGFIIREPVYVYSEAHSALSRPAQKTFWGLISIVFGANSLFDEANLPKLEDKFDIALRKVSDGTMVYGNPDLFMKEAILRGISIPSGNWQLAMAPSGGWINKHPNLLQHRQFFAVLGFFALMLVYYLMQLRRQNWRVANQLRGAIEVLPDGFVIYDDQDRLVMCNDKYKEFYKRSAVSMVRGNTFEDILRFGLSHGQYPEAKGREEEWLANRLNLHRQEISQVEQQLVDGRWVRIIERATPDGGRAGVRLDITAIKEHEAALKERNAQLKAALAERDAAEARFADLSDISTEWFWEQDEDMRFTFFSSGFERATGIPCDALIGKRRLYFAELDDSSPDHVHMRTLLKKIQARETFRDFIYRARDVRDTDMWVRTSGIPFYDADGNFRGYKGVAADVTPLYTALRAAQKADQAKTQFLNVISHELRTPLTVMMGFNAFLAKPEMLPSLKALRIEIASGNTTSMNAGLDEVSAEIYRYGSKIQEAGSQLQALISDMLDLARIESQTTRLVLEKVAVRPTVKSIIEQLRPQAAEKGLKLTGDATDEDVYCDSSRLKQILNNLIGNALKFTDQGEISVTSARKGDMVEFQVRDTGVGIGEDHLPNIFHRFMQVDSTTTRNNSGVGLGLTITHELVKLQGGEITVESTLGEGSCFTFTLPVWDATKHTPAT